jgi:hypothetical protein
MRPPKAAICAAAVACLAVFTGASAQAAVFDFSFGPGVIGTFTTGAAAADPGFDLITGLTFGLLSGTDLSGVHFSFANEVASDFAAGAAFDPTTAAFINHSEGSTFDDIGGFGLPDAEISGISFSHRGRGRGSPSPSPGALDLGDDADRLRRARVRGLQTGVDEEPPRVSRDRNNAQSADARRGNDKTAGCDST